MANFEASYPLVSTVPGGGTVTSVGVITDASTDGIIGNTSHEIPGSPVTGSGNMTLTLVAQAKNLVLAGPATGADAAPTFRALVAADVPGSGFLPGGSVLSGVYQSDVFVDGAASLGGDVTIDGDLIVDGNLTNTGGGSLTVKGNLIISGGFLFTPSSTATAQGNVTIGGDASFGANSDFRVNPGQAPAFSVHGNLAVSGDFDGSGQAEAPGLQATIDGDVHLAQLNIKGGDSAGVADGQPGGIINVGGSFNGSLNCDGGNSAQATFNAGDGGAFSIGENFYITDARGISCRGGSVTVGNGHGGNSPSNNAGNTVNFIGGTITTEWNNAFNPATVVDLSGGDASGSGKGGDCVANGFSFGAAYDIDLRINGGSSTSGAGGQGGSFTYNQTTPSNFMSNCSVQVKGGAGGTNGGSSSFGPDIILAGNMFLLGFDGSGGAGTSGNGGAGAAPAFTGSPTFAGPIILDGGAGNAGSGTGGAGGALAVTGTLTTNSTFSAKGGTGGTPGADGTLTVGGNAMAKAFVSLDAGSLGAPSIGVNAGSQYSGFYKFGNALGFSANGSFGGALQGGYWEMPNLILNAAGTAGTTSYIIGNSTTDKVLIAGDEQGDTTKGGVIVLGYGASTNATTIFYNAGAQTGSISSTGQWTLGAASTTPQHAINTSTSAPAAGGGTLLNMPAGVSGNPTGYILISINGSNRVIPFW